MDEKDKKLFFWLKVSGFVVLALVVTLGVIWGAFEWRFRKTIAELEASGVPMTLADAMGEVPEDQVERAERFILLTDRFEEGGDQSLAAQLDSLFEQDATWGEGEFQVKKLELLNSPLFADIISDLDRLFAEGRAYFISIDPETMEGKEGLQNFLTLWQSGYKWVMLLLSEGRVEEAEALVTHMIAWDAGFSFQPLVLTGLVRAAYEAFILESARVVMASGGFQTEQAHDTLLQWINTKREGSTNEIIRGERAFMLEMVSSEYQEAFIDYFIGVPMPSYFNRVMGGPYLRACLPNTFENLPTVRDWGDKPPFERSRTRDAFTGDLPVWDKISPMLMFSVQTVERRDIHLTRFDLLEIALALEAYRQDHDAYPEALSQLPKELPVDRFTGKPFKYRREGESYLLYSVGRNLTDEGGKEDERRRGEIDIPWRTEVRFPWEPEEAP